MLRYVESEVRIGGKNSVQPWLLRCSYSSFISWIHNDAPLVSRRIHSHSLNLETIQLRPFPTWKYQLFLGVESDSDPYSLPERWVRHLLLYMEMYLVSHFVGPYKNRNLRLAFRFLSSIPPIGIKKGVLVVNVMLNGPVGPSIQRECLIPTKLSYRPNSQEMSLLEEQCKLQNGQPSLKAIHKYLRKTYRLWVSGLRLLATSVCFVSAWA